MGILDHVTAHVPEPEWRLGLVGACRGGHMDLIRLMIERGADDWNDGLIGACEEGQVEAAELMMDMGATRLGLAMTVAANGGHRRLVARMKRRGAKIWGGELSDPETDDPQD
jgi:hypothetical protein